MNDSYRCHKTIMIEIIKVKGSGHTAVKDVLL